jgi:hypothetical protein
MEMERLVAPRGESFFLVGNQFQLAFLARFFFLWG